MEEIKSSIRSYKANEHYRQSLKGPPLYYRVSLNDTMKRAGTTIVDAEFDVRHVFPNQRADLMNGEWHVFLESFEAKLDTQLLKTNIKVCLPDLIKSSQDYVMTDIGVCQINDAVGHVPITQEYRATQHAAAADPIPAGALAAKPIAVSKVISADSIGVKIDPVALFSGQIRVLLRDEHHDPLVAGNQAGEVNDNNDGWRATLLFVHKA
jgi:hypothetical protein